MDLAVPRGIRNNNPCNIRWGPMFQGIDQTVPRKDPDFIVFTSLSMGLRAVGIILRNYERLDHCSTLSEIIARWAPPIENDTDAYLRDVCKFMGYPLLSAIQEKFPLTENNLSRLIPAMADQEDGTGEVAKYIKAEDVAQGVAMALAA